jgi:hypothetical protein
MSWNCPACSTVLRHSDVDTMPSSNERYRCHVCRLSLNFDAQTRKLVITEFEGDHEGDHYVQPAEPKPARRLPTPVDDRRKETRRPAYRAKTA